MLEITTSTLKTRKRVEIDGHPYVVRRLGAGEQLTINQMLRQARKLEDKVKAESITEKEELEAEQLSAKMMDIFSGLFDDGGDGTKSRALISSLNENEITELFSQVFSNGTEVS